MEGNNQCQQPGCDAEASDFCIFCKKNYCQDHVFGHECNSSGQPSYDEENNLNSDSNDKENSNSDVNRCAYPECSDEACDICSFCNKYYCQDHFFTHICVPTDQLATKKTNKNPENNDNESANEIPDTKCDFLCCTGEAPFFCSICQQHYCEKHALDHECYQFKQPNTVNTEVKINTEKTNTEILNNETKSEIKDSKCDFLGCTGEAPFFCSVCQQYYCANHAFKHECKH